MKSKELIQAHIGFLKQNLEHDKTLNPRLVEDDEIEIKAYENVLKDLEDYEELKELMGTPIQDIMKRLKILEIIKKWSFLDTFYMEDTDTTYEAFICNIHNRGMKKDFGKVKEWLDGKD